MGFKTFVVGLIVSTLLSESMCGIEVPKIHVVCHTTKAPNPATLKFVTNCLLSFPQRNFACLDECIWTVAGIVKGSFGNQTIGDQEEMTKGILEQFSEELTEKPIADKIVETIRKHCTDEVANLSKENNKCSRWESVDNCITDVLNCVLT